MTDGRAKQLAEVAKKLNASKKSSGRMGAAEAMAKDPPKCTTGSISLDIALGGGFQLGRVYGFSGNESCGKTSTTKRISGNVQNLCRRCYRPGKNIVPFSTDPSDPDARWSATGECDCYALGLCWREPDLPEKEKDEKPKEFSARVEAFKAGIRTNSYEEMVVGWADLEQSFEPDWAWKVGLDPRRVLLLYPTIAEEAIDLVHALADSGLIDMMVVDSIAQMTPRKEYEESSDDWQQGLLARIMNKGARKWMSAATKTRSKGVLYTQVWINQLREKIGAYGDPTTKPGGKGQAFAAHVEVRFLKSTIITHDEQYGNKDEVDVVPMQEKTTFRIEKSKISGTKKTEGFFITAMRDTDVYKAGTILEDDWLYTQVMHYLAVETKDGYKVGDQEFKTQKAVRVAVLQKGEFRDAAIAALVKVRAGGRD